MSSSFNLINNIGIGTKGQSRNLVRLLSRGWIGCLYHLSYDVAAAATADDDYDDDEKKKKRHWRRKKKEKEDYHDIDLDEMPLIIRMMIMMRGIKTTSMKMFVYCMRNSMASCWTSIAVTRTRFSESLLEYSSLSFNKAHTHSLASSVRCWLKYQSYTCTVYWTIYMNQRTMLSYDQE